MAARINYTRIEKLRLKLAKCLAPYGYRVRREPDIMIVEEVPGVPESERWFMRLTQHNRGAFVFDHKATLAQCIQHCQVMGFSYDIEFHIP